MKTSIVILNWNTLSYLKKCVKSIKKYTRDYEIIIVDNGSTEKGTKEYIKGITKKYIFNTENLGFAKGNNLGTTLANGEFICFMNSDVIVGKDWLIDMLELFKDEKCGAVGPLGNPPTASVGGINLRFPQYKGMCEVNTKIDSLAGFCLLMKTNLFKEIGWDEGFIGGNYEDNYLSYLIRRKGYDLWICAKAKVTHTPGRTFEKNNIPYLRTLESNRLLFERKVNELIKHDTQH